MKSSTVNISFDAGLLMQIDKAAQEESRSRSELIWEAARAYIERKKRWQIIFSGGRDQAKKLNIKPADVGAAIRSYRRRAS